MNVDWGRLVIEQLEFYWDAHLWPRLQGLTDDEYLWEPVEGCWSLRPDPDGRYVLDGAHPAPEPPPVTTIAWRMMHVAVGCFLVRSSTFFPDPGDPDVPMWDPRHIPADLPGTADEGLAFLERTYQRWHGNIAALDAEGLARRLGRKGAPYGRDPMGALIVHINREVMHHGGEIGVLRDLYRAQRGVAQRGTAQRGVAQRGVVASSATASSTVG